MEEKSRKIFYFFLGIILPLLLVAVSFLPWVSNILLTIFGLVWFGFALILMSPVKE